MPRSPGEIFPEIKDTARSHPQSCCTITPSSVQMIKQWRDEMNEDDIVTQQLMGVDGGDENDQEMMMKRDTEMMMNKDGDVKTNEKTSTDINDDNRAC